MKVLTILMIGLAIGVSGCGKKKKATPKDTTNKSDKPKGGDSNATVAKGKFAYTISGEGDAIKIQITDKYKDENQKTMKSGTCDMTELAASVVASQNPIDIMLKDETLTISAGGNKVLEGKAADDKKTTIDGKYDAGDGVAFEMGSATGEGDLAIQKACEDKKK